MNSEPKHRGISRELAAEIANGKYGPGDRLPSETQLVQRFRVSRPTVARALRDLQDEGLVERRAGSGTYLKPKSSASAPNRQLGLLVTGRNSTEILDLTCGELAGLARAQNSTLLWEAPGVLQEGKDLTREGALELCDRFIAEGVAGVFFTPFEHVDGQEEVNQRIADRFAKAGVPVVLLDRDVRPFPRRSTFDLVGIDNVAGGCLIAEHLIKLGARRLAFVARPNSAPTVNARMAGVREALIAGGLEIPPDWIQLGDPEEARFVRSLIAGRRWDAMICANDLTAVQLLPGLRKAGVQVPLDLRVVGFDDTKQATLPGAALTTVHQPCRDIAITAFRALLERIAEPTLPARSLLLTPQLVVRESCGAYLPRSKDSPSYGVQSGSTKQ